MASTPIYIKNASNIPPGFNYKKADWDKFGIVMKNQAKKLLIPKTLTPTTLYTLAEEFTSAMNSAAESAIPRLRPCKRSKPWWTEDLKSLRKLLHSALRVYKQTRIDADYRI